MPPCGHTPLFARIAHSRARLDASVSGVRACARAHTVHESTSPARIRSPLPVTAQRLRRGDTGFVPTWLGTPGTAA